MHITDVLITHIAVPLPRTLTTAIHEIDRVDNVLVEVVADDVVGSGYAFAFSRQQARSIRALVHELTDDLIGQDATLVGAHWQRAMARSNFLGRTGPAAMAIAAIDTALWDLLAQRAGVPLATMLGRYRDEVPVYATGGWTSLRTEELLEEADALVDAGFRAYKIKIGRAELAEDVARVERLVEHVGGRLDILVDANQAWTAREAIRAGRALERLGVTWLEEPVDALDHRGGAAVTAALDVPIAAGETVFGVDGFQRMMEHRSADVLMPDLMRCAGPTGFRQIALLAAAEGFEISSHLFTEVSAHLIASAPTGGFVEYLPGWWDRLLEPSVTIVHGRLPISAEPGIGVHFSPAAKHDLSVDR